MPPLQFLGWGRFSPLYIRVSRLSRVFLMSENKLLFYLGVKV